MEINKWLIIAVILGITTVAIVAAVAVKKKKSKAEIQVNKENKTSVAEENVPYKEKILVDENLQLIVDGIRNHAESFNGLYEGVFQIAHNLDGADSDTIDEWKIRVKNIREDECFKVAVLKLFDSDDLTSQAVKLLEYIELAGIKRSEETAYAFEKNVSKKYVCLSGNSLDNGTLCTVLKPYWHMDSNIVEQGYIIRKEV